jgi:hypothetical protein
MAIRCEEEFNPWPSFVDIFSAVILVLMLFLLVTIVNIGYYAQFKYKVQYTGSIVTEDIILQDTTAKIKLKEKKEKVKQQNKTKLMDRNLMEETEVVQMQVELQAATDIESAGEDLADKKKSESKSPQKITQKDKFFYIKYEANEYFVGLDINEKVKEFIKKAKEKYPGHQIHLSATDPLDQISITVTKQITPGRTLAVRNLLKKMDYAKKDIKLKLGSTPEIPEEIEIDNGVVVIEVVE